MHSLWINYLIGTYLEALEATVCTLEVSEISRPVKSNRPSGSFCFSTNRFRIIFMTGFTIFTVCIASTLRRHKVDPTGSELSSLLPLLNPNL